MIKFRLAVAPALVVAPLLVAGTVAVDTAAYAQSGPSCYNLWLFRNQIYKDYDYCFKTKKALNAFGPNGANCTRNPRLSRDDQQQVAALRAEEKRRC